MYNLVTVNLCTWYMYMNSKCIKNGNLYNEWYIHANRVIRVWYLGIDTGGSAVISPCCVYFGTILHRMICNTPSKSSHFSSFVTKISSWYLSWLLSILVQKIKVKNYLFLFLNHPCFLHSKILYTNFISLDRWRTQFILIKKYVYMEYRAKHLHAGTTNHAQTSRVYPHRIYKGSFTVNSRPVPCLHVPSGIC